jgi:hypothetical protein
VVPVKSQARKATGGAVGQAHARVDVDARGLELGKVLVRDGDHHDAPGRAPADVLGGRDAARHVLGIARLVVEDELKSREETMSLCLM